MDAMRKKTQHRSENWERQTASYLTGLAKKIVIDLIAMTKQKYDTPGSKDMHRGMSYARVGCLQMAIERI